MDPVCFTVFGKPIYWYGVLFALSFMACATHWNILGRREGRPPHFGSDLALVIMIAGIVGARLGYVLANFGEYAAHPGEILRIDRGGLIFYGGFILSSLAALAWAWRRGEGIAPFADFVITAIPLGHAFGRVGCFINGCCYGKPWDGPFAVFTAGAMRHPVQLYETAFNVLLYLAMLVLYLRKKRAGTVLALSLVLYGAWRFAIEFLRGDERLHWVGLDVAQEISIALIGAGLLLFLFLPPRKEHARA